ncbi:MAG: pilus assembly protein [Lachnospiraceae bacterium]|nr:pilus assembly protein [Lachnospiraceae bacterium]
MNSSISKKEDNNKEKGMMTVEAVLCLVPFILVILGIISFINIFIVHSKIQVALYETANELSAYTYFYQALGVRAADGKLGKDIEAGTAELTAFLEDIETARSNLEGGTFSTEDFTGVTGSGRELVSSPQTLIRNVVYLGIGKAEEAGKTILIAAISEALTENYLDTSFLTREGKSADAYLKAFGVRNGMKGMDFGQSKIFMDSEFKMIDIVVEYDLDVYFFRLLFKDPSIHIVQRAIVPAWLDGDGGSY